MTWKRVSTLYSWPSSFEEIISSISPRTLRKPDKSSTTTHLFSYRSTIILTWHFDIERLIIIEDLLSLPSSCKQELPSPPFICAEIHYWILSIKLPLNMIHMHTVIPFSTRSLTSTQDSTANNDKVTCDAKQQLGPHPTKNAASSSSSSSLYSPLICPDLLPMI